MRYKIKKNGIVNADGCAITTDAVSVRMETRSFLLSPIKESKYVDVWQTST